MQDEHINVMLQSSEKLTTCRTTGGAFTTNGAKNRL